jgi:uncharacterized protein (UPF0128 family)
LSFYEGVGVGVVKIKESESKSEVLCTDSTALVERIYLAQDKDKFQDVVNTVKDHGGFPRR